MTWKYTAPKIFELKTINNLIVIFVTIFRFNLLSSQLKWASSRDYCWVTMSLKFLQVRASMQTAGSLSLSTTTTRILHRMYSGSCVYKIWLNMRVFLIINAIINQSINKLTLNSWYCTSRVIREVLETRVDLHRKRFTPFAICPSNCPQADPSQYISNKWGQAWDLARREQAKQMRRWDEAEC